MGEVPEKKLNNLFSNIRHFLKLGPFKELSSELETSSSLSLHRVTSSTPPAFTQCVYYKIWTEMKEELWSLQFYQLDIFMYRYMGQQFFLGYLAFHLFLFWFAINNLVHKMVTWKLYMHVYVCTLAHTKKNGTLLN